MKALKRSFRKDVSSRLSSLSSSFITSQSLALQKIFLNSELYQSAKRVGIYLHMPGEAATDLILADLLKEGSPRICFVPCIRGGDISMVRLFSVEDFHSFIPNKWGIPEPPPVGDRQRDDLFESDQGLDLLLVPGLAFDAHGGRLGRGKGYYDRFLAKYFQKWNPSTVSTVGYAFDEQIVDKVPRESHDKLVDFVLTPSQLYEGFEKSAQKNDHETVFVSDGADVERKPGDQSASGST